MALTQITILGSGTSGGIPEPGCGCAVCRSKDPRDKRYRTSVLISFPESRVVIDAATEFRLQMIREEVCSLDALLVTHAHADHISGMDDLRNYTWEKPLPVFGNREALDGIRERFSYFFKETQRGGGKPRVALTPLEGRFLAAGREWIPLPVLHGQIPILGYRCGGFAYITDASFIPPETEALLGDLEVLILGALRYRPHETHMTIDQAVDLSRRLNPGRTWLTHFCHDISHERLARELPERISPAFDGLKIDLGPDE